MLIEKEEFIRWLKEQPEGKKFRRYSSIECPIAEFLLSESQGDFDYVTVGTSSCSVYSVPWKEISLKKTIDLPQWATKFIFNISEGLELPSHIKPDECLLNLGVIK